MNDRIQTTIVNDDRLYFLCKAKPNYDLIGKKDVEGPESDGPLDQDEALPTDLKVDESAFTKLRSNPFFDFGESIGIFVILIYYREILTPDFIHFVTCIVDDEAHFICITVYWLVWKCFLVPPEQMISQEAKVQERVKIVARGLIEMTISLLMTMMTFDSMYPFLYCYGVYILASVRSIYYEKVDLTATIFFALYFFQNFVVNSIDFIVYKQMLGFYHDELFLKMFSYKLFQFVNTLLMSFVFAQGMYPTFEITKECPEMLSTMFKLTIPGNLMLLFTFLYELTFYDQH